MADVAAIETTAVVSARDVALFVRTVEGGGESVIAVHGGPGVSSDHLAALAPLVAAGVDLVLYDQRGVGRSSPPVDLDPKAYALERYVADLEAVRAYTDDDAVVLIGHSWGAIVAASYAARYPDRVSALVLIDPASPTRRGLDAGWASLGHRVDQLAHLGVIHPVAAAGDDCTPEIASVLPAFNADPSRPLTTDLGGTTCSIGARVRTWAALGDYDLRATLTRITAPVLLLHGRQDPYGDTPSQWVVNLRAPHEVVYLDDCGHRPMHECPDAMMPPLLGYATR